MKKVILGLFVLAGFAAQAQITLSTKSLTVSGPTDFEIIGGISVTNTSDGERTLRVRRFVQSVNGTLNFDQGSNTADNWFCWDACFPPQTNVSGNVVLALGQSTNAFTGHLLAQPGNSGTAVIKYCFFNATNQADSSCATITYNVGVTSVADAKATVGAPYPNPANDAINFNYSVENSKNATLKIYNMLGSLVKSVKLAEGEDKLTVNTADFKPGIYLYDLQLNNRSVKNGRFSVQ